MKIEVYDGIAEAAVAAARLIAAKAREAAAARGRFSVAFSGGSAPLPMLRALALENVPWNKVHVFQVDERVAPAGDDDRNFTHLAACLLDDVAIPVANIHPMPVGAEDLHAAASGYADTLARVAGAPPVLDLAHLGFGLDGHTASLIPGDAVLDVADADVAISGVYQGRQRMTLTYPALDRARCILWFVTGGDKAAMLARVMRADSSIPAGRVRQDNAVVIADKAAAGGAKP